MCGKLFIMRKLIKRFISTLYLIKQIRIVRVFKYADIIVYKNSHPAIMDKLLLDLKYSYIDPMKLYVSVSIVIRMLRNIQFIRRGVLSWNHASLLLSLKPKLVVTLIDNSSRYHYLDKLLHKHIRFIAIQNGSRFFNYIGACKTIDSTLTQQEQTACLYKTYHSEFFCFGEFEVDLYNKLSAKVDKFYPVGSLINSIHMENNHKTCDSFDLCLVSSYGPDKNKNWIEFFNGFDILCNFLSLYLKDNPDIRFCISARSMVDGPFSNEERHWYSKYGLDKYLRYRKDSFSTHQLVDSSTLTITAMSTVFFDSLARDNKVVLVNANECKLLLLPTLMVPNPLLYIYKSTYRCFQRKINDLISMEDSIYNIKTSGYAKYMMNNSHAKPTYKVIYEHIKHAVQ